MSNDMIVHQPSQVVTSPPAPLRFPSIQEAFKVMAYGLSETSKRQYEHTFNLWREFCADTGLLPHQMSAANAIDFLGSANIARKTKQARLTHLRRLAQTLHTGDVGNMEFKQNYEQLKLLKLPPDPRDKAPSGKPRIRKALAPDEVFESLRFWPQNKLLGIRNRALLAVLFYAGLRRSEAVALRWSDIDLEGGFITVQHGKGDKFRIVPLPQSNNKPVDMLRRWRSSIPAYEFVFVAVGKGDKIGLDKPISTETVRRICDASGDFKPHDARRTFITNLLNADTKLHHAQAAAGHANGSTTMHYAMVKDAHDLKANLKLPY